MQKYVMDIFNALLYITWKNRQHCLVRNAHLLNDCIRRFFTV